MDTPTFLGFRRLIYDKSGINIGEKKEALVLNRVGKRMRALGIDSYKDYLKLVHCDESGVELSNLLDVVSTNVTHFYREPQHFDFLGTTMKQWVAHGRKKFRVWCAACSSGEEPYSIAITMADAARKRDCDIKILATDICRQMLEKGRTGVYSKQRVNDVPAKLRSSYFSSRRNGCERVYTVHETIKQMVRFARLNLSAPPFPMSGPFDVIFIRNVMIYFDNIVRKRLLDEAYRLLVPGGYLV
ncbi:MAG: methyltransferase domain-containing protein, partial [Chitinivibrionales bacterium]|nr:methyltransferase domain-containing protein [Chitinivibrionales bacterium]